MIQTNATNRGVFPASGNLGWHTMSPTTFLHIDCNGGNLIENGLSDVRFESLEAGKGTVLVNDKDG